MRSNDWGFEILEPRLVMAGVVINEFLAVNTNGVPVTKEASQAARPANVQCACTTSTARPCHRAAHVNAANSGRNLRRLAQP